MGTLINTAEALDCAACPLFDGAEGQQVCSLAADIALSYLNAQVGIRLDNADVQTTIRGYLW
jgi:hypothetical protein